MNKKINLILVLIIFLTSSAFAADNPKEAELLFMAKKAYEDGFYEVSLGMLERLPKNTEARLLSGQCYFYQGRYLEAANIFEELFNDPQSGRLKDALYFWLAEVHFKGGNFEKASALYQKLINDFGQSAYAPAAYYSLGWSLSQMGKYKQAQEIFDNLTRKFPLEPQAKDAAFKTVECLYNLKEYAELRNKIAPVLKLYSADTLRLPYLYFYLAESEYYLSNLKEAINNYLLAERSFKEPKAGVLAKLGLGWSYLKLAKFKEAQEIFLDIKPTSLDKKNLEILILGQAMLAAQTNRAFEAKKLYEQLINISTDPLITIQAYLGKADMLSNLADYPQAVNVYQEALAKAATTGFKEILPAELINKLRYNLSLAYLKNNQTNLGVGILEEMVEQDNDQQIKVSMLFQLADIYEKAQDFLKAEKACLKILSLYPDSPFADYAYYRIGLLQFKRGDLDNALISLNLVLKNYPQSKFQAEVVYALGSVYFQKKDYSAGLGYFNRFKTEFQNSPLRSEGFYMLAVCLDNLKKYNEAIDIFKEIPKIFPKHIELVQNSEFAVADGYDKLGQEQEAFRRFKLLRSKYPDAKLTPDILGWLGQYYYRHNDFNLARRYFYALTKDFPTHPLTADAYYALGLILVNKNNFSQAIDNFKEVIKQGSPDLKVQATLALAELYYKNQDYPKAKEFYNKSLEVAGNKEKPLLYFKLAETLEANSEFAAAIQQYFLALKFSAQNLQLFVHALLRIAKIYEDKEDFVQALTIYKSIIHKDVPEVKFAQERIEWIKANVKMDKK